MIKRILLMIQLLLFNFFSGDAQQQLEIAIVSDAAENETHKFEEAIKAEIEALLSSKYQLNFDSIFTNRNRKKISNSIKEIEDSNQADLIIASGVISSNVLANKSFYKLPSIASIQLTNISGNNSNSQVSSGISNFTYINSPFNIGLGIKVLLEICQCNEIAILTSNDLENIALDRNSILPEIDGDIQWIRMKENLVETVNSISQEIKGVYILSPLTNYSSTELEQMFESLASKQLPSFTLLDHPMLELGAYASFDASTNITKIPRRIALNVERILEGEDAKNLPVLMETFSNQLRINMETVHRTGKYPKWKVLDDALLININKPNSKREINLKSAIAEGIQNNLGYQIEEKQTQISSKEVDLAKSNYLPQLEIESTGFFLDENTINSSFGSKGTFNWTAGASFSQLILSEPALANIAIQKLLYQSQEEVQKQSELDVILEVTQRYFNYMQVLSLAELYNDNIKAINQNLTIAKDKEKVGYSSASDVYRWHTELELAKTDLYEIKAQIKSIGYQLNETLNRPISELFKIKSTEDIKDLINEMDEGFSNLLQDQYSLSKLSDFMVQEAFQNLPEIHQIELAIKAQERLLKSNQRSFYLPTIAFGAGYEYTLKTVAPGETPIPGFEVNNEPTWNAAFNLSIPIFTGGSRRFEKQKNEVGLFQLQDQYRDAKNILELQVRANMENANASYNNIRLTRNAAQSALQNITIVRDLYKTGQIDIITLVDAQNALLGAQINATNATFQFMIDYFTLQRSVGNYYYLETESQKAEFLTRFINFKTN